MSGAAIELDRVQFSYPGSPFRLHIDSLKVAPRECIALVGRSGSGKTTIVHLVAGILLPSGGSVSVDSVEISRLGEPARRARRITTVGMVFQEFELLAYLSALDNVLLPYLVSSALEKTRDVEQRALELASAMGIRDLLSRKPERLSQGERQRVALARALVTRPRILLCDEPTGNLDAESAGRALDLLLEQARANEATLVVVTHDRSVLGRFDRVIDVDAFSEARA